MADTADQTPSTPPDDGAVRAYAQRHGAERAAQHFGISIIAVHRACDRAANRLSRAQMMRAIRRRY